MKDERTGKELEEAWSALGAALPVAARTLVDLLDAQDERVRLRATLAILNRGGISEAQPADPVMAMVKVGGIVRTPSKTGN